MTYSASIILKRTSRITRTSEEQRSTPNSGQLGADLRKLHGKAIMAILLGMIWFTVLPCEQLRAQGMTDQNFCTILASKLTPDYSTQTNSETRFKIYKNIVSSDVYKSFGASNSSQLDAGLTVVDYVDATLGTRSNESNWETNRSKFNSMTIDQFKSSNNSSNLTSRWNPSLIESLLAGCHSTEFYGQVASVAPDKEGFTIKLHGSNTWKLTGIAATPLDPLFACGGDEKATKETPIENNGDRLLSCTKDQNRTLTIVIHTTAGEAGPFEIYSVADTLRRQTDDELAALGTQLRALQGDILELKATSNAQADTARSNSASIALVKAESAYMIVSSKGDCPSSWNNIGQIGFIIQTGAVDRAGLGRGGPYGGGEWTWTHPYLCKRQ